MSRASTDRGSSHSSLLIPADRFSAVDIERPIVLDRRFDLAICLEVAEHISERHTASLVESLVSLAPVVVFSAAIPGQSGVNHVNERWQDYWASQFESRDYAILDCLRPFIWSDASVQWWYAQNVLVFVSNAELRERPDLLELSTRTHRTMLNLVHPRMLEMVSAGTAARPRSWPLRGAARIRRLTGNLVRRLRRRPAVR